MKSNTTLLTKADIIQGNFGAGTLRHKQADKFFNTSIDKTSLSKAARMEFVDEPTGDIAALDFDGEALVPADYYETGKVAGATLGSDMTTMGITSRSLKYNTSEFRGVVGIRDKALEDNLVGDALRDQVLDIAAIEIGNILERILLMSDVYGNADLWPLYGLQDANSTAIGTYKQMYGWYAWGKSTRGGTYQGRTRQAHLIDFYDLPHSTDSVNYDAKNFLKHRHLDRKKLLSIYNAMPDKWSFIEPSDLRWITNQRIYWDYAEPFTERDTNLGDQLLQGQAKLTPFGIPFGLVPQLPINLRTPEGEQKHSFTMLTHYQNFVGIIQRRLDFETFRNPYKKQTDFVFTIRLDAQIDEADMLVVADGIEWKGGAFAPGSGS